MISFAASWFYVVSLPETVPTHWDLDGAADTYGRPDFFLLLAALPIIAVLLLYLLYRFSPIKNKKGERAFVIISGCIICFLVVMSWIFLISARKGNMTNTSLRVVMVCLGIMLIIMGNYLPVIEQNSFMGVRTPWTLKNELVWKKTQRLGGILFLISGMSTVVLGFFQSEIALTAVVIEMLVMMVVLMLYSYILYKKVESK